MVPYAMILEQLRDGTVIPFLGSGVVAAGRDGDRAWKGPGSDFLPRDDELATYLSAYSGAPSPEQELSFVAHCYSKLYGRKKLDEKLRDIYAPAGRSYQPGRLHRLLTRFPDLLIVTLCRDHLLERAFLDENRPVHRVAYRPGAPTVLVWPYGEELRQETPNKLVLEIGKGIPVILQLYGTFETGGDRPVVTEADHVDFLARLPRPIPACFAETLKTRDRLLLGCPLEDWSLRLVFDQLKRKWPRTSREEPEEALRRVWGWAQHLQQLGLLAQQLWTREHNLSLLNLPLGDLVDELDRLERGGG